MSRKRSLLINRLEDAVLDALVKLYPEGGVGVVTGSFTRAKGYWASQDVRRWDGCVVVDGKRIGVSSWSTMRECARGVTLTHHSQEANADWSGFDANPIEESEMAWGKHHAAEAKARCLELCPDLVYEQIKGIAHDGRPYTTHKISRNGVRLTLGITARMAWNKALICLQREGE